MKTPKLENPTNLGNCIKKPGSQLGVKSKAVLECLRKNGRRNKLDLEMLLRMQLGPTLNRMESFAYVIKCRHGSATGCYEITNNGRAALGESIKLNVPSYAPITGATMFDPYVPGLHNQFQSRVSL